MTARFIGQVSNIRVSVNAYGDVELEINGVSVKSESGNYKEIKHGTVGFTGPEAGALAELLRSAKENAR